MSLDNALRRELLELVVAYTNGAATDEQFSRLEELLDSSDEAMTFYLDSLDTHANLYWYHRNQEECLGDSPSDAQQNTLDDGQSEIGVTPSHTALVIPAIDTSVPNVPSAPPILPATFQGMLGYVSSGWSIAYLAATVITGLGIAIAAIVHVSQPMQMVTQPTSVSEQPQSPSQDAEIVGKITGMVECNWGQSQNGVHVRHSRSTWPKIHTGIPA